jgi:Restriction endonuclease
MDVFRFDHLSPTEFEEFCYDLLSALGATKLNWRKGTALASSPADRGRDIECEFMMPEVGGEHRVERWFVECKHHKTGVPPQKISAALSWAAANKPDCLLLIASGFFSNPCKDLIEKNRQNNPGGFRIKLWERKDCERHALAVPQILRKNKLFEKPDVLRDIHPAHAYYLRWPQYNTLGYLFEILERVGPERFPNTLGFAYSAIINPSFKQPTDSEQTFGELLTKTISYSEFRRKCLEVSDLIDQGFLVQGIMCYALSAGYHLADENDVARQVESWQNWLVVYAAGVEAGTHTKEDYERFRHKATSHITRLPELLAQSKVEYREFCESVVAPLLLEEDTMPLDFISARPTPPEQGDSNLDDVPF